VKARLQAYRQDGPNFPEAILQSGARVTIQLEGPDADVQRIVDLGLKPIVVPDKGGMLVQWYDPAGAGAPSFDAPGGFKELFGNLAVVIYANEEPVFVIQDIERREKGGRS
jgi:hypothetical protein